MAKEAGARPSRPRRLRGMRLRDEFACPITYELMRDPAVAADGHSYDRHAIDMWLRTKSTSPKTGEPVDKSILLPNHNLKRLIEDLMNEGGEGLYVKDDGQGDRVFELTCQKFLVMKCLGPPDSDWNERTFQVTPKGALGGRRQPTDLEERAFIPFTDTTVSRRHFEIAYDEDRARYLLKDLGSAGGTFVRVAYGKKELLRPGMILLMGKHQFLVQLVADGSKSPGWQAIEDAAVPKPDGDDKDDPHLMAIVTVQPVAEKVSDAAGCETPTSGAQVSFRAEDKFGATLSPGRKLEDGDKGIGSAAEGKQTTEMLDGAVLRSMMRTSQSQIAAELPRRSQQERLAQRERIQRVMEEANELNRLLGEASGDVEVGEDNGELERRLESLQQSFSQLFALDSADRSTWVRGRVEQVRAATPPLENPRCSTPSEPGEESDKKPKRRSSAVRGYLRLCLKCFAPDMSPIQGREYIVDESGATIGRKSNNTIHFCHTIDDRSYGVDNSVSAEHARIALDSELGGLVILDGSEFKPSTNGTWYRLSEPGAQSDFFAIEPKMEVLVGTVRFQASEIETLTEHPVSDSNGER